MSASKESKKKARPSSPLRGRTRTSGSARFESRRYWSDPSRLSPSTSLLDREANLIGDDPLSDHNPRSFPHNVKQQCWEKARRLKEGTHLGGAEIFLVTLFFESLLAALVVFVMTMITFCLTLREEKASTLESCQVLQATVNRSKGNRTEISRAELIQKSSYCRVSGRDMDLLELSAFGNVHQEGVEFSDSLSDYMITCRRIDSIAKRGNLTKKVAYFFDVLFSLLCAYWVCMNLICCAATCLICVDHRIVGLELKRNKFIILERK